MFTSNGALALTMVFNFANSVFNTTIPGTTISFKTLFLSILITSAIISVAYYLVKNPTIPNIGHTIDKIDRGSKDA